MASSKHVYLFGTSPNGVPTGVAQTDTATGDAKELTERSRNFFFEFLWSAKADATTCTVKVQHSSDRVVWYDVAGAAFTAVTGVAPTGNEIKIPTSQLLLPWIRAINTHAAAGAITTIVRAHYQEI